MAKRMILMLLAMGLLVGGILGYKLFGRYMMNKYMAAQKPPPAAVSVAEVRELTWSRRCTRRQLRCHSRHRRQRSARRRGHPHRF